MSDGKFEKDLHDAAKAVQKIAPQQYTEAELAEAKAKAAEMLKKREGLQEMRALMFSYGIVPIKALLANMVDAGSAAGDEKKDLHAAVAKISPISEHGGHKVEFYNRQTRARDSVYLMVDICPKEHDTGAELNKILPLVPAAEHAKVLSHFSQIAAIARAIYHKAVEENAALFTQIHAALPPELQAIPPGESIQAMTLDVATSTLFALSAFPKRLGFFVRRAPRA